MVRVEIEGRRITVQSHGTHGAVTGLDGAVPGAYYSKYKRHWTVPLSLESCRLMREHFGQSLEIGPQLWQWALDEKARRSELGALSSAADGELSILPKVAPFLASAMASRTYQRAAVRFVVRARNVLLADEPGLGKTLEAIGGIIESEVPGPYLVVCPKTAVQTVWARELPRWTPGARVLTVPDGRAKRDRILDEFRKTYSHKALVRTWIVVHPEMVQTKSFWECGKCSSRTPWTAKPTPVLECGHPKDAPRGSGWPSRTNVVDEHNFPQLFGVDWGAIVLDESHESLVRKTGTPTQRRRGLDLLGARVRPEGIRIAASGTPWRGKPHQLWGTLNWLDPKTYSGFWRWAKQYWETGGYTGFEIKAFRKEREPMMWDSLKPHVLRRTKDEVAPDMPRKTYVGTPLDPSDPNSPVGVWLEMDSKQRRAYDSMANTGTAKMQGGGEITASVPIAVLTRLRQLASSWGTAARPGSRVFKPATPSNKLDYIVDLLEKLGHPGDPQTKVVIVSEFTSLLDLFAVVLRGLKFDVDVLTGKVSASRRDQIIGAFNGKHTAMDRLTGASEPQVLLMNSKVGGVAITIDTADHMVFVDEARDPDVQTQAEDRIHRVSNPRPVFYHYLRSLGTVEVTTAIIAADRSEAGRRLLDVRRTGEEEYARTVLDLSRG